MFLMSARGSRAVIGLWSCQEALQERLLEYQHMKANRKRTKSTNFKYIKIEFNNFVKMNQNLLKTIAYLNYD